MKRKFLIHAGFHKTGTTSVQSFLYHNRELIWPHAALAGDWRIPKALKAATRYSKWRKRTLLRLFGYEFSKFLGSLDLGHRRGLCMSAENLSGAMPGRPGINNYDAAPDLMKVITQSVERIFGPEIELCFYFSTRPKNEWLRSSWKHNLRMTRLRDDFPDFAYRLDGAADWPDVLSRISTAIEPHCVLHRDLNQISDTRFGPASPIVEFFNFPAKPLRIMEASPPQNRSFSDDAARRFLALNRSNRSDAAVSSEKEAVLQNLRNSAP